MSSRANKLDILQRIASGKLSVSDLPKPLVERNYILVEFGLYKCIETEEFHTYEDIRAKNQRIPIDHWFFFIDEERNENNEVIKIKQRKISTSDLLDKFTSEDFLELMKKSNSKH